MIRCVPLGELITRAKVERAGVLDLPVLSMTRSGGLVPQESVFKKKVASRDLSKYKVVRPSQLVVGIHIDEGALGVSGHDQTGIVSPAYVLWDLPDSDSLHPDYLHRYIRSPPAIGHFVANYRQTAERRGKITRDRFLALEVPLPPLAEQKRIAGILDAADALRAKRRESLAQLDTLLQSTFLDMFGDPATNPMGWEVVESGELFLLPPRIGTTTPARGQGHLVVRVGEVGQARIAFERCGRVEISERDFEKFRLEPGDTVIARAIGSKTHLGKASFFNDFDEEVVIDSHVMRLRPDPSRCDAAWVYSLISSDRGKVLLQRAGGATAVQFNINTKQASSLPVALPPVDLQHRFAAIFESVEQQKATQRTHLSELDTLFASLQSRAFAGDL